MSKILLVEDNDTIILGLKYLFDEEKFEYDIAMTKKDAIVKIKENKYDIAILEDRKSVV